MNLLEEKTAAIVDKLFEEEEDSLETDGSAEDEEILRIARCLRKLGDEYNDVIQGYMKNLKPEFKHLETDQGAETFSGLVNYLNSKPELQTHLQQLGSEMNVLRIAVVLGIQIAREVPELIPKVKTAMELDVHKAISQFPPPQNLDGFAHFTDDAAFRLGRVKYLLYVHKSKEKEIESKLQHLLNCSY